MKDWKFCKHEGTHIKHGRGFNQLTLCNDCGGPVIKDIFDIIAYLNKPRYLASYFQDAFRHYWLASATTLYSLPEYSKERKGEH